MVGSVFIWVHLRKPYEETTGHPSSTNLTPIAFGFGRGECSIFRCPLFFRPSTSGKGPLAAAEPPASH